MKFERVPLIAKYLSVIFMVLWIGSSTVWNFLPIFIEQNIENVFLVGIITSLPAAIPILLDIPIGNLVQRAGARIVIFLGLLVAIAPPLMYLTAMPIFLVLGKAFEGLNKTLIWNGGWSLALEAPDENVESESISVFLLGVNLATVIGPVIGGFLIAGYGFPVTFWIWALTAILAIATFYTYVGIDTKMGLEQSLEKLFHRRTYLDDWHHIYDNWEALKLPLILIFTYSIIFSFYWLAIPLLLDKIGADFQTMGLIFGAAALPKAFQFIFGDLADKFGDLKLVTVLSVPLIIGLAVMSQVEQIWIIGILFFVTRTLSSGMSPAVHSMFDKATPDELEGELTGFLEFFKHSGQTIGPILAGTIASIWTINASYLSAAGVGIIILGISLIGAKK